MKKTPLLICICCFISAQIFAQSITLSPTQQGIINAQSSNQGILVPRMSSLQRLAISLPTNGLLVYDTDSNSFWYSQNGTWSEIPKSSLWSLNIGDGSVRTINSGGFWSSYSSALAYNADNLSNPPNAPTSGAGTRLQWIPSRSAFCAGTAVGSGANCFNADSLGLFSFTCGLNSRATSRGGVALGVNAVSDGTSNTIAIGESTRATGNYGTAIGSGARANSQFGVSIGRNTIADGTSNTLAFGESSRAAGDHSVSMGTGTLSDAYYSMALGYYNNTISGNATTWVSTDPLFYIGNGQTANARSNAFLILKNGKTCIGSTTPQSLLHVFQGLSGSSINANSIATFENSSSGYIAVLTPENNESGVSFGLPSSMVSGGIYYNTNADKRMTFRTNGNSTKMTILAGGNVGVGEANPTNLLHIHNSAGVESSIRFTNQNSGETTNDGIEVGYNSDGTGKFLVKENKNLTLGTNNVTRMTVLSTGSVGINTATPAATLDVAGTTKIGTNGTALNEIIRTSVTVSFGGIPAQSFTTTNITVTNAATGSTVSVSPDDIDLPAGFMIAWARVSSAGNVRIKFYNANTTAISAFNVNLQLTIIR